MVFRMETFNIFSSMICEDWLHSNSRAWNSLDETHLESTVVGVFCAIASGVQRIFLSSLFPREDNIGPMIIPAAKAAQIKANKAALYSHAFEALGRKPLALCILSSWRDTRLVRKLLQLVRASVLIALLYCQAVSKGRKGSWNESTHVLLSFLCVVSRSHRRSRGCKQA